MQADATAVNALLTHAAELLRAAGDGEQPAANASYAIRLVMVAAEDPGVFRASADLLDQLETAFDASVSAVVSDASGDMPREDISFGLGAACGVLQFFGRSPEDLASERDPSAEILDRLDHAALLADELAALVRRRRIAARGNCFRQFIEMKLGLPGEIPAGIQLH